MEKENILFSKISKVGLCLLVFLLPWQTRLILEQGMINGNPSEYLTLSLYGVDIILLSLLLIKIINFKFLVRFNLKTSYFVFSLLILWCGLSIVWSLDKLLAGQRVIWLFLAIVLAWLIYEHKNKAELIFWFATSLALSAVLGIWQFLAQFAFANKWLGLGQHNPLNGGVSIVEIYSNGNSVRWLRAYGSFDHPNILGTMMAVGILLTIWLVVRNTLEKWKVAFLYVAILCMSVAMFMSLSRSAWVGFVFALLIIAVKHLTQKDKDLLLIIVKPLSLLVIVFAILAIMYPSQLSMRAGGKGRLEIKSVDDRVAYMIQAKEIIKGNSLLGVGAGNYVITLQKDAPPQPAWTYQPVHNIFLYIWAELGFIGFILVVTGMLLVAILAWKNSIYFLAIFASLIPSMFLDHWLWDLHIGILLVGFLIGIFLDNYGKDRN